jgi:hypothetical protein
METKEENGTDRAVIGRCEGNTATAAAERRPDREVTGEERLQHTDGNGGDCATAHVGKENDVDMSPAADSSDELIRRTWDDVGMYQGYTPLTDDAMWNGQGAMLTTIGHQDGDSDDGNLRGIGGGSGGVFFADMSAFFQAGSSGADDGSSSLEHDETTCHEDPQYEPVGGGEFDFRSVADLALAALDREYQQVVSVSCSRPTPAPGVHGDDNPPEPERATAAAEATVRADEPALVSHPSTLPSQKDWNCDDEADRKSDSELAFVADFAEIDFDADGSDGANGCGAVEKEEHAMLKSSDIDVEAVQRAVHAIQVKRPGFVSQADDWAKAQENGDQSQSPTQSLQLLMTTAPMNHAVIPSVPLKAFRRRSAKAVAATSALTRSATIAEALHRLDLLQSQDWFVIHVVGCDFVECQSENRIRAHFGHLVNWIGSYAEAPRNLTIVLIGPSIPASAPALLNVPTTAPIARLTRRLESAEIRCLRGGLYHECLAEAQKTDRSSALPSSWISPDLVVAFHAGIWGYSTWEATFEHRTANSGRSVPWVVTAYTIQEAEDDADALEGILLRHRAPPNDACREPFRRVWPPEWNPFASQQPRETVTAPNGRAYRENAAWSCWKI